MVLLDLLGRRWTLRILWEMRERALNFRELRDACDGMSMSVLNERLAELREAEIVEQVESGYCLSDRGRLLLERLAGIDTWAKEWARRVGREKR